MNIHATHFEQLGSSSERETLMCLRVNNNRTTAGKIRCPERETNPRLTDFMTGHVSQGDDWVVSQGDDWVIFQGG